jgi:hypothetical protein
MMNDLKSIERMRGSTPVITPAAEDAARARLLDAMRRPIRTPRRPVRRLAWRIAVAGALAVAVGVALPLTRDTEINPGHIIVGPMADVRELGERAARAAETEPAAAVRADQWLYVKQLQAPPLDAQGMSVDLGKRTTWEQWTSVDGRSVAWYGKDGKLLVQGTHPGIGEAELARPPVTPEALIARIDVALARALFIGGEEPEPKEQRLFQAIYQLMGEQALSPAVRAALFRALPTIAGVSVRRDAVDAAGRRGVAFSYTGGWARYDLILNPDDYSFLGTYGVSVRDRTFHGLFDRTAPDEDLGSARVNAGTPLTLSARIEATVVDTPGERL